LQLAFLMAVVAVALLALRGYRPYFDEFRGRVRQTLAAFMFIGILAVAVFYPVTSFGKAEDIDPATIWFPALLVGHCVLLAFLLIWWRMRADVSLAQFLRLSMQHIDENLRRGIVTGVLGWMLTLGVTAAAAAAATSTGHVSQPSEVPPLIAWLAALPVGYKLIIVAVAMTVEEAFFRAFLQARIGLVASSILFALSHFSYGLPFMIVGVFTISLVIGRAFQRSGDLLPCIVAHGVFDGVQLLVILPLAVRMWGTVA